MPYNSFEHYSMSWSPDKDRLTYPYYASIASLLEDDITDGFLPENTLLPPQRELADFLDLSLSTITKAYKLCELKGLVYGIVGKGTFVSVGRVNKTIIPDNEAEMIEMGITIPFYEQNQVAVQIAGEILIDPKAHMLFEYSDPFGTLRQRAAAQKWMSIFGIHVPKENICIASGAQNALAIALISHFNAGDKIITDTFTYPNFISLANMLNIQLISVKGDEDGIIPEALEQVCKNSKIRGIYLMPSCSNPTNVVMSHKRRKEIARLIKKHELILIEDDTYAFLSADAIAPLSSMLTEQSIYINGVSKALCAGLRVAYMSFPNWLYKSIKNAVHNVNLKTPSLNVEIATEIILRGTYRELIARKRLAAAERNDIFAEYFHEHLLPPNKATFFQWLHLPDTCTGKLLELKCREAGVNIYGSERFCVGESNGINAVRISISSPPSLSELRKGLGIIRKKFDDVRQQETPVLFV